MTTVYLIRHAEAEGNLYRIAHGQYDGLITDRGYQQLRVLKKRFDDVPIDAVYSSDLFRARTTARAIYEPKGLELHLEPAFREIHMGCWEGRPWQELNTAYGSRCFTSTASWTNSTWRAARRPSRCWIATSPP